MVRKSGRKSAALVSTLVRMEDAAEEEILETPAVSSLGNVANVESGSESEEEEDEEAELERRLVEEQLREEEIARNERENKGIYNGEALKQIVADWDKEKQLHWVETLDTCVAPLELTNVHDDLKREVAFYNNSLASVRLAKDRLKKLGVAYKRPEDYFAEMLKSDAHMAKVKDKLIYEQKKIHAVEERKKSQAHRKVAKEIQAEKTKQRLQEKKDTLDAVKQWKKRRNQDKGGAIHDDDDNELDAIVSGKATPTATGKRKRGADSNDANKKPRVNKKRESKDKKYGFGGKKRYAKSNTRESTNDMSQFRKQRPGSGGKPGGKPGGKTAGKAPKPKRAGKTQRSKQRTNNKR
ncbi:hypothetical protein Poli38472_004349 [Pythium oligandrum]|uniref:rRNA-processing protein EBP2 n=1 Tax=Pythium oligandrum TaxID=41045 RepID=A0A8K1FDC6_PYTOL|nr:hypothetical protein Poli38472_004349 [Pythium oligandrum]|eukprot:TMW59280.1 hypothetical protein Poli38472_004349 [Pythium oligandrum]